MSSLALYRRYRPESFAEVIGQEHVTDPLQQALRNNRVNHAYLFSGPRGCGKTTSARILARCLNCEQGPTPTPCGECESCKDLARNGPGSIDVIEIDAASHGGVDDARDLREKAFFGPARSRYKIYIIDEAHMVTSAGFNALLKVVEEPPEHLKFIFATTEPEKVIGTIRSRTHHYPFRLVPPGTLRDYLGQVCQKEDIPVEDGVLPLVVRAGAGSVRDSMSVMDQLLAGATAEGVTYGMATSLLGYTDGSLLDSVVESFATGDGAAAFEVVDRVIEGGNDPRRFVADLLERLRDLVILAAVPDAAEKGLIDAPADVVERMQAQAGVFGAAELSRAADLVNEGLTEMRGATSPRLQLELICARVMLPAAYSDERSLLARLDRIERGASFVTGAPPAGMPVGYEPASDAHQPVPPGGGAAAARAAVRGGAPTGTPQQTPPAYGAPAQPQAPAAYAAPAQPQPPAPYAASAQPQPPAAHGASAQDPAAQPQPPAAPGAPAQPPAGYAAPAQPPAPYTPPAEPAEQAAPGAWPTPAPPGAGRKPGGWPTAANPGSAARPAQAPPSGHTPAAAPGGQAPGGQAPGGQAPGGQAPGGQAPGGQAPGYTPPTGGLDPRMLWPNILEAVKNRRRFAWILLSQNAQVTGFDGTTLQLGFVNAGARDKFASSGSEEALKQALAEQFNAQWKIDAVVDASGGGGATPGGAPLGGAAFAGPPQGYAQPAPAYQPPAPQQSYQSQPPPAQQAAPTPQPPSPTPPPPVHDIVAPEDDVPEDDDPDLNESALSGHELIVRELGATVMEEFTNE
ncbi:DNA polymerase III subunit gamma and tau [Streptomyces niveiscabiei]|uniref:DNA polymerase III subunit gamma/tau n=1 Tax=Streptomyces niveiscabiei TaxID=164115 RepID=A0ABW9HY91_9ACTN